MYNINKNLNKFVFVGEICHVRDNPWNKERVRQWLKESGGKLLQNEQSMSKEIATILSGSNFNLIQAYFFILKKNKLWNTLNKEIGVIKANKFRKFFENFTQRFDILWEQKKLRLLKIKNYLNSQSKKIESILAIINRLSDIKKEIAYFKQIPVHLVISSKRKKDVIGWFSILDNKTDLVLECSGVLIKNYTFLNMILLHEYFHLALRTNSEIKNQIENISKKNQKMLSVLSKDITPSQILEELLISSFVPEGYFATKYFNKKIKPVNSVKRKNGIVSFVSARQFCAYKLKNIAKKYINTKKSIDKKYLSSLIDVIKNR